MLVMIFIPLFAVNLNLSLSQIFFIMGVMYLPYMLSFLFAEIADRFERITIAGIGLLFSAIPMFIMYYTTQDYLIAILSMFISLSLALINPAVEGIATAIVPHDKRGEIT